MAEQEEVLEQASEGTEAAQPEVVEIGEGENFSRQQVEEIVKSALEKEITGLKANNSALKEEKKKVHQEILEENPNEDDGFDEEVTGEENEDV